MNLLDGKNLSQIIRQEIKQEVEALKKEHSIVPGLAVILVGDDMASKTYVNMKSKACKEAGIYSIVHEMPNTITQDEILSVIAKINENELIDGVLVQLPLPKQIDKNKIIDAIDVRKDVDGFHPFNLGNLLIGKESFAPCTPLGIMLLLSHYKIDVKGMDACVVGASDIVGKPLASLLLKAGASVDICHIYTKDLKAHTQKADILLVGVGKQNLITKDMVKKGAIVVDIGTNKDLSGKLVGDVDFANVAPLCEFISPVPGGVGPMTIATLLKNTLKAAKQNRTPNA